MTLNNREIIFISYSTEGNWTSQLPKSNWLCIIVDNNSERNYINEVISKIIENDVCYVCTVGNNCEFNHDLMDEEIVFRLVDIDNHYLPKHHVMTTWHNNFNEGIWFAFFAAHDEDASINKVVILDMTNGLEKERIIKLLEKYKISG